MNETANNTANSTGPKTRSGNPQTPAAVFRATEELLLAHGAEALSIAAIAGSAGIGVGSVYNYFESKEALLFQFLQAKLGTLLGSYRAAGLHAENEPWEGRLQRLLQEIFSAESATRAYVELADIVFEILGASAQRKLQASFEAELEPLLAAGIHAGSLRPWPLRFHATLLIAYIESALRETRAGNLAPEAAAEMVWRGFVSGHQLQGEAAPAHAR